MKMLPVLYCFSFGTLVASVVTIPFSGFCRKRSKATTLNIAPEPRPEPKLEPRRVPEKDRMASAIRSWTVERADADLSYAKAPAPPIPPPVVEIQTITPEPAPPKPQPEFILEATAPQTEETNATIAEPNPFSGLDFQGSPNFYEILQISPRADLETIHRVYRIMAARFHPDNPVSGNHERFLELCEAYEVLSRPERRAQYDVALRAQESKPLPIFETPLFVDGIEGEMNRRLGILALLYQRRRLSNCGVGISTLELERRMALPREHLEFTLWYLRHKNFVHVVEDNSDYAITTAGVDYVEANSSRSPILQELIAAGKPSARPASAVQTTTAPLRKRRRHQR
jgi:hypothetical protein